MWKIINKSVQLPIIRQQKMIGFVYPFYGIYVLQKLSEVGLWLFIFLAIAEITKIYRLLQDFIENGEQWDGSIVIHASDWALFYVLE